jgi:hypothetical protein
LTAESKITREELRLADIWVTLLLYKQTELFSFWACEFGVHNFGLFLSLSLLVNKEKKQFPRESLARVRLL